jgi:hypothetical protein
MILIIELWKIVNKIGFEIIIDNISDMHYRMSARVHLISVLEGAVIGNIIIVEDVDYRTEL